MRFEPCHDRGAVGPMAGILSPSMPVLVVENAPGGTRAFATMNEGLGKVHRFGAYDDEVLARLRWLASTLGPTLDGALKLHGPVDLRTLITQALQMGDECHNRNAAATSLFARRLASSIVRTAPADVAAQALDFLAENDHFFLNLSMAACKATMDAAHGIGGSTVVTAMARNGVEFGIRVSGTGGAWFTAQATVPNGLYFPGYGPDDANPDLGDSAITETRGIGGFAMAAAPAIVRFVGGTSEDALGYTRESPSRVTPTSRCRRSGSSAPRRRSTSDGSSRAGRPRSSTPASPIGSRASGRSGRGSRERRWPASRTPCARSAAGWV